MVWDMGSEYGGLQVSPVLLRANGVVAAIAAVACGVGIVSIFWNLLGAADYNESVNVANLVAAAALAALAAVLCWFADSLTGTQSDT